MQLSLNAARDIDLPEGIVRDCGQCGLVVCQKENIHLWRKCLVIRRARQKRRCFVVAGSLLCREVDVVSGLPSGG